MKVERFQHHAVAPYTCVCVCVCVCLYFSITVQRNHMQVAVVVVPDSGSFNLCLGVSNSFSFGVIEVLAWLPFKMYAYGKGRRTYMYICTHKMLFLHNHQADLHEI